MRPQPQTKTVKTTLAILAGGSNLPALIAEGAHAQNWPIHLVTFTGQPQPDNLTTPLASHTTFGIAAIGAILKHLKANGVTHIVLAGNLTKPSLFSLKPDATGLKLLPRIGTKFSDDHLLRVITQFLAEQGFTVVPVTKLLPSLRAPAGTLTKTKPAKADLADIKQALSALKHMGKLDVGQALVIHHGTIIGVEAVEGTNALIERCANLRGNLKKNERAGWLVKAAKPGQTKLADLPAIGPETIKLLAKHNYAGLAIQAETTLLIAQSEILSRANHHNLIIHSVK